MFLHNIFDISHLKTSSLWPKSLAQRKIRILVCLGPCGCGERRVAPSAVFRSRNPAVPTPRRRRASAWRRGFRRTPVQPESSVAVAPASPRRGRDLVSGFRAHSAPSWRTPFLGNVGSARRSLRDAVPPRRRPGRAPARGQAAHRASARTPFGLAPPAVPFPVSPSSIAALPSPRRSTTASRRKEGDRETGARLLRSGRTARRGLATTQGPTARGAAGRGPRMGRSARVPPGTDAGRRGRSEAGPAGMRRVRPPSRGPR